MELGPGTQERTVGTPPPIATTPPTSQCGPFEELQSQSSSPGTQISSTSGISLGEAIRQTASQGMESWYQLPVEDDVSSFMPTLHEQTELPTMEEGTIHSEPDLRQSASTIKPHSISLEIQDSHLSPCLPLLTSDSVQRQRFFDDTLFQQTEMDFAPLRGSFDTSEYHGNPSESLQISDAVTLASKEVSLDMISGSFTLSQHQLAISAYEAGEASSLYNLSQHPLPIGHLDRGDFVELRSHTATHKDTSFRGMQSLVPEGQALSPQEQVHKVFSQGDGLFLDTNVPAPLLLELLEKEIGMSGSSGMSSSRCSSQTISDKETENIKLSQNGETEQQKAEILKCEGSNEMSKPSDLYTLGEEFFQNSREIDFFNAESLKELEQENEDPNQSGITIRSSKKQSIQAGNEELHKVLCSEIEQKYKERELSKNSNQSKISSSSAIQTCNIPSEPTTDQENEKDNMVTEQDNEKDNMVTEQDNEKDNMVTEQDNEKDNMVTEQDNEKDNMVTEQDNEKDNMVTEQDNEDMVMEEDNEKDNIVMKQDNEKDNVVMEVPSNVSRAELTISSRGSIERGYKETGISPADNPPIEDSSFIGRLAHPISQSTPGTFSVQRVKKQLTGKIMQIKAKLTGSEMSLNEEPLVTISQSNTTPYVKHQSLQSSHISYPESTDSQRSSSPPQRRIQSLPSLNYIEKVGAWNTNQSFDALVLRGLTGVSPKKKAYNAVADSLNRMLSNQSGSAKQKRGLAASFAGTSSMTSLNSKEKDTASVSQITRSQSYNSVSTLSTENQPNTKAEGVVKPLKEEFDAVIIKTDAAQNSKSFTEDIDAHGSVSITTVVANDLETEHNTRDNSQLERVLSAAEGNVNVTSDTLVPNLDFGASNRTMDRFSDVSLDADFLSNSQSSDQINQIFTSSTTAASVHSLTSLEIDNFVPFWSPSAKSPERKEINIEERIPMYLRNLGIDQSPTTILTPFVPKGPIREPEFSPSELRTIKGSTATPSKSLQLSEGGSQGAVNISQSSVYSTTSTTSVSIPMGSEHGHDSPLPTESSLHLSSSSTNDRPISQYDLTSHHDESKVQPFVLKPCDEESVEVLNSEQETKETSTIQPVASYLHPVREDPIEESKWVKQLVNKFEHRNTDLIQDLQDPATLTRNSEKKQVMDSIDDSFVGSKTLKEIRKLLAETDTAHLNELSDSFPLTSPLKTTGELSPLLRKVEDSLLTDPLTSRTASPGDDLVGTVSWDASLNCSGSSDNLLLKNSSAQAGLDWDNLVSNDSPKGGSYMEQIVEDKNYLPTQFKLRRHIGRSEPEGSNEETIGKLVALNIQFQNATNGKENAGLSFAGHTAELLNSVTSAVGGLEQALAMTSVGYTRRRDEALESDDSSADSLAARVKSLLRNDAPVSRAAQIILNAEESEKRARGSSKLKLTAQSSFIEAELNEEDRKRIEEIKQELLEGAKEARVVKNPYRTNIDLGDLNDTGHLRLHFTPSPDSGQLYDLGSLDMPKETEQLAFPNSDGPYNKKRHGATATFKENPSVRLSEDSHLAHTFEQLDTISDGPAFQQNNSLQVDPDKQMSKSVDDITKPIASITFASRKRFSPLSFSNHSEVGYPELTTYDIQPEIHDKTFAAVQPAQLLSKPNYESLVQAQNDQPISHMSRSPSEHVQTDHINQSLGKSLVMDKVGFSVSESNSSDVKSSLSTKRSSELTSIALQMDKDNVNPDTSSTLVTLEKGRGSGANYSSSTLEANHVPSPTRKALSCVHVTISPVLDNFKKTDAILEKQTTKNASDPPNSKSFGILQTDRPEISKTHSVNLSNNNQVLSGQDFYKEKGTVIPPCSYFLHSTTDIYKSVTKADGEDIGSLRSSLNKDHLQESETHIRKHTPLSDATTQITTESPVKTTFSSEIFINDAEQVDLSSSSNIKTMGTSDIQPSAHVQLSYLARATDQPLLLPYRPPGSPEFFYVPYHDIASRISPIISDTTVESSHPGSNDAVSPAFPIEMLGSPNENVPDVNIRKHKDGIYSKHTTPKIICEKNTGDAKKTAESEFQPPRSQTVSKPVQRRSQNLPEDQFGSHKPSRETFRRGISNFDEEHRVRLHNEKDRPRPTSHHQQKGKDFLPLKPEVDYSPHSSRRHGSDVNLPQSYGDPDEEAELSNSKGKENYTSNCTKAVDDISQCQSLKKRDSTRINSQITDFNTKTSQDKQLFPNANGTSSTCQSTDTNRKSYKTQTTLNQSIQPLTNQSLDDLWARFTERKKHQLSDSSNKLEMSLVERLDRLARLLRSPVAHSLSFSNEQDKLLYRNEETEKRWERKMKEAEKILDDKQQVNGGFTLDELQLSEYPVNRNLQHKQYVGNIIDGSVDSDFSSEVRSTETESATTDTETVTQTDSDTMTQTGVNSTVSTIDTVRLIKAFGPERVRPSSRLSHLYNAIDSQKKRTEESKRKHSRNSAVKESKIEMSELPKSSSKVQVAVSDTASTASWEPSPALIQKKKTRLLNKGVQAGDFEIVTSATRKHTRDVGTTFPSPCWVQQRPMESSVLYDRSKEENTWTGSVLAERGAKKNKWYLPQGMAWFVPAEDLKSDSRKENHSTMMTGPSLAWQIPLINTKPVREPLREKNLQDQLFSRFNSKLNGSDFINDAQNKSQRPFVKITLQESLKTHRPDFLFRSGERVKRLQLLAKERKLQTMFQIERDQLFNQLASKECRNYTHLHKDSRTVQKSRTIPKKEMVQRSRRMYEQLPEIKKKKEDEKRRSEYETYRLKAQLFRKKVTNNILGRKTPWN